MIVWCIEIPVTFNIFSQCYDKMGLTLCNFITFVTNCLVLFECHWSKFSQVEKWGLSSISWLDPWRTGGSWRTFCWFLMAWRCHVSISRSLLCQKNHQECPYPPSPGWILGGQVVPDALSGGSCWPWGSMFQFPGVSDIRKTNKKAPILHLQVGSLEDRGLSNLVKALSPFFPILCNLF